MESSDPPGRLGTTVLVLGLVGLALAGVSGGVPVGSGPNGTDSSATVSSDRAGALAGPVAQTGTESELIIESTGDERAFYEVRVSGSIELGEEADTTGAEFPDSIEGSTASGSIAGGTDDFSFTGAVVAIEVEGPASVSVDGEEIDPDEISTPAETTTTEATTETETETGTTTAAATETPTATGTRAPTETTESTPTTTATEPPTTATTSTPTATPSTPEPTTVRRTTAGTASPLDEQPRGAAEPEQGLFLTVGAVLVAGALVIGGFALLVRR